MVLIARKPSQELVDLVGALGGRWHGRTAMVPCPAHADRKPSLAIRQGDRGILVTCFAGCASADVLRELRRVRPGRRYEYADLASRSPSAERLWSQSGPVAGSLAERYLASRDLLPVAPDLRFHPRCPVGMRPRTTFHPALIAAVREGSRLTAVQRTLLDPVTARVRAKMLLGRPGRGAWQGGGGQGASVLALAEGFETARAFTRLEAIPCWATLGARRFHQVSLPDHISHLVLAADNDAEGQRAADRAEAVYSRPGLTISRAALPFGFNDWAEVLGVCGTP